MSKECSLHASTHQMFAKFLARMTSISAWISDTCWWCGRLLCFIPCRVILFSTEHMPQGNPIIPSVIFSQFWETLIYVLWTWEHWEHLTSPCVSTTNSLVMFFMFYYLHNVQKSVSLFLNTQNKSKKMTISVFIKMHFHEFLELWS